MNQEFLDVLYEESQGIIDAAMKIYALAQHCAIMDESETITVDLIKYVARKGLIYMRPMLDALKSGDPLEIAKYGDMCSISFDEIKDTYFKPSEILKRNIIEESSEVEKLNKKITDAINQLMNEGVEYDIAEQHVEAIAKKNPKLSITEIAYKAFNKINKKPNSSSKAELSEDLILLNLYKEAKETKSSVYSVYEENRIIKGPLGEFKLGRNI